MQKTTIPWATHTWNPTRGCFPVSEGCRNCYAAAFASRFSGPGMPYEGLAKGGKWTGEVRLVEKELHAPLRLRKPARIFVNSMGDLFESGLGVVYTVLAKMLATPQHTFIILTKRPNRAAEVSNKWWSPNCWLGVSVESQAHVDRIDTLLKIPVAKRVVSFEPLLGPVKMTSRIMARRMHGIHWVICGPETGPQARPFDNDWAREICDVCDFTVTPFFYKHGSRTPKLDGVRWTQIPEVT